MTQTKAELLQTRHQGDIRLGDADSTHYVGFKAPATVGTSLVWTLPATDGTANYLLKTDGSGNLGWVADSSTDSTKMPLAGGTFTGNTIYNDNAKAIFGTSSDGVEIYHSGSGSYIKDSGTGDLIINSNTIRLKNAANDEHLAIFDQNSYCSLYYDNVKKFETTSSGSIVTGILTASDFNSTSDIRLKTNIQTIEDPLAKVIQIEGVSFNWKEDNRPAFGVIADQVQKIIPELVHGDNPKTVNYNGLIGLLIEAVKEQQTQIDELKSKLS